MSFKVVITGETKTTTLLFSMNAAGDMPILVGAESEFSEFSVNVVRLHTDSTPCHRTVLTTPPPVKRKRSVEKTTRSVRRQIIFSSSSEDDEETEYDLEADEEELSC